MTKNNKCDNKYERGWRDRSFEENMLYQDWEMFNTPDSNQIPYEFKSSLLECIMPLRSILSTLQETVGRGTRRRRYTYMKVLRKLWFFSLRNFFSPKYENGILCVWKFWNFTPSSDVFCNPHDTVVDSELRTNFIQKTKINSILFRLCMMII